MAFVLNFRDFNILLIMIDLTFSLQERGGAYKRGGHRYIEEIIAELPGLRQVKCLINYATPHVTIPFSWYV